MAGSASIGLPAGQPKEGRGGPDETSSDAGAEESPQCQHWR